MYHNLRAEMKRHSVRSEQIAKRLGLHPSTMSAKINNNQRLRLFEAKIIRDSFFPDLPLDYLFAESGEKSGKKKRKQN